MSVGARHEENRTPVAEWRREGAPPQLDAIHASGFFERLALENVQARWFGLVTVVLTAVAFYLINRLQGTLWPEAGTSVVADLRALLTDTGTQATGTSAAFPLLRDLASLSLLGSLSVYVGLLYHQWRAITNLVPGMLRSGVVEVTDPSPFNTGISRFNRALAGLVQRRWWIRGAALAFMLAVVLAQRRLGIYSDLSNAEGFGAQAYNQWWAGTNHPAGLLAYLLFGWWCIYLILLQNAVGVLTLKFFHRVNPAVRYRLSTQNPDGHFGWRPFRSVMATVYASILLHAIALVGFFISFSVSEFAWVLPMLVIFLALNPFYVAVPLLLMRRSIEEDKQARIDDLLKLGPPEAASYEELVRLAAIREEVALVRKAPAVPFNLRAMTLAFAIYVVPLTVAVLEIISLRSQ